MSLPGGHGSGDLGRPAHAFLEFLADAGQGWWQMLPVGPPGSGPGWSPYSSPSAFAGSPLLVSLEALAGEGRLSRRDLDPAPGLTAHRVNFRAVSRYREERLRRAFGNSGGQRDRRRGAFRDFCEAEADWLEDFALFSALQRAHAGRPWTCWDDALRRRDPKALAQARKTLCVEVEFHRFVQFQFERQWQALRRAAHQRGIRLIGDLPILVAHDSADVWSHQDLFRLQAGGEPRLVSGYPPDRFNRSGQVWGHPLYDWPAHRRTGYAWWVRRFARQFALFDAVRIDHFLGFTRLWGIPSANRGGRAGRWLPSPGFELFSAVQGQLGPRAMIAEDLGHVTAADRELRDRFGLLAMRILQFGFGREPGSAEHLPGNLDRCCAAYTGTHDNDTLVGWYRRLPLATRRQVLACTSGAAATVHLDALRALLGSSAVLVIAPLQDVLGLGSRARMNVPGTTAGNWRWRLEPGSLTSVARTLRHLTRGAGRAANPVAERPTRPRPTGPDV